jgi:hypothetical protein
MFFLIYKALRSYNCWCNVISDIVTFRVLETAASFEGGVPADFMTIMLHEITDIIPFLQMLVPSKDGGNFTAREQLDE